MSALPCSVALPQDQDWPLKSTETVQGSQNRVQFFKALSFSARASSRCKGGTLLAVLKPVSVTGRCSFVVRYNAGIAECFRTSSGFCERCSIGQVLVFHL